MVETEEVDDDEAQTGRTRRPERSRCFLQLVWWSSAVYMNVGVKAANSAAAWEAAVKDAV